MDGEGREGSEEMEGGNERNNEMGGGTGWMEEEIEDRRWKE
jgi:hypothetical protein